MGDKSKISWTDASWNPVTGCTRVSPGCDHCYAFALHDKRYAANRKRSLADQQPAGGVARARAAGLDLPYPEQYDKPFSRVQLMPERLDQPLRWKKPRRIFVNSMSDLFHEDVSDYFILQVWMVMAMAREHTFQILTKRPGRMRELLKRQWMPERRYSQFVPDMFAPDFWPLPNVWLGVSVEDQQRADERIPLLLDTPAAVRFISAEPLLGPIDLRAEWMAPAFSAHVAPELAAKLYSALNDVAKAAARQHMNWTGLDWIIVGGESGKGWRPMDHAWAQSIRDQCRAAGVAYFGKQDAGRRNESELPGELGDREFPA